ncbi:MAG: DNA starvation/stationary phase protection protein [Pseudanabaenaceae cyanobacterium SKYGB_i_bin29]|nr:DNA starvation/stationary phase protection protein [Pseudanabaenaceae cyanobacterium SKYG29]MDW8420293.1 DNA starvation/stationary phase protection protein [Pseudanabaenaceae cyanobacterium SKYGB_i_bin29]
MDAVVKGLNRQQANALVMYLNYKKYHWLSYGPLFRDLHLLFEEHGSQVLETIDELAERSLVLGGAPVADPDQYLKIATVQPSVGSLTLKGMVEEAIANHDRVIDELHQDADTASQANDIGTADLFTRIVQVHQKQRWFLREILRRGDGLVTN